MAKSLAAMALQQEQDLIDALAELQSAAWRRSWTDLQAARARVMQLTGLNLKVSPLRRELEKSLTTDQDKSTIVSNKESR